MAARKSRAVAVRRGGTVALVEGGVRSGIHGYQKGTLLRSDLPTSTNSRLPRGLGVPRPSFRVRGNPVRDFFGLRSSPRPAPKYPARCPHHCSLQSETFHSAPWEGGHPARKGIERTSTSRALRAQYSGWRLTFAGVARIPARGTRRTTRQRRDASRSQGAPRRAREEILAFSGAYRCARDEHRL